eukprot:TRINITY_DN16093_c0_g1_i1.p1 TRINITY_DN16093_c0_g1~~TRINITY_DN16093_c0_g1_i1.p1  ORF type:complete len:585 (-),score=136.53 TRINITY_DN16093_c0_g1_i1:100-1854(-)
MASSNERRGGDGEKPLAKYSGSSSNADVRFGIARLDMAMRQRGQLDPLTMSERQAVSRRIRAEITDTAVEILRTEQDKKEKLNSVHIKCVSLLVLAGVAIGVSMVYLRVVLVPFILAIFFMFLLEPLLFAFLQFPGIASSGWPGARRCLGGKKERKDREEAEFVASDCGHTGVVFIEAVLGKVWGILAVALCLLSLLFAVACIVYFLVQAFESFPWKKYASSPRVKLVLNVFPHLGTEPEELDFEKLLPWLLQGPLLSALDVALSVISQCFLCFLFLAFLLANDVHAGQNADLMGLGKKIRTTVRRYIRIKTALAMVVASLAGGLLWHMRVDLYFVFAFLTFVLYYIPHVGNTVAVIAPLPLVFLDPGQTWGDLFTVFIVPFIVHQLAINLVEPKLLASSLDLHAIVVLISLAFWTTVWGAMGAVLSVPLTAVLRMMLLDVDHPYAKPLLWLLKGEIAAGDRGPSRRGKLAVGDDTSPTATPTRIKAHHSGACWDDAELIKDGWHSDTTAPKPSLAGCAPVSTKLSESTRASSELAKAFPPPQESEGGPVCAVGDPFLGVEVSIEDPPSQPTTTEKSGATKRSL